ncbi:MAG: WD40 domain-containing protein, partial [candidate division WWE3 bacterium GW2011_GWA2_42_9]
DGSKIIFSSDRGNDLVQKISNEQFEMNKFSFKQLDLYSVDIKTNTVDRITDWEFSDEKFAAVTGNGNDLIFVSDKNGINNLYEMKLKDGKPDSKPVPLTNSLSEITQPSITADGKKLVFSALYNLGYNIFMLNNLPEMKIDGDSLRYTNYMGAVVSPKTVKLDEKAIATERHDNKRSQGNIKQRRASSVWRVS